MRVSYTQSSQADIESLYEYIARAGGIAAADCTIDAISATCEDIGEFPALGRRRSELDDLGLEVRSIGERGYVIFYTSHDERIHILRVVHGSRDIGPETLESLTEVV